jgi:hypothetical protein
VPFRLQSQPVAGKTEPEDETVLRFVEAVVEASGAEVMAVMAGKVGNSPTLAAWTKVFLVKLRSAAIHAKSRGARREGPTPVREVLKRGSAVEKDVVEAFILPVMVELAKEVTSLPVNGPVEIVVELGNGGIPDGLLKPGIGIGIDTAPLRIVVVASELTKTMLAVTEVSGRTVWVTVMTENSVSLWTSD